MGRLERQDRSLSGDSPSSLSRTVSGSHQRGISNGPRLRCSLCAASTRRRGRLGTPTIRWIGLSCSVGCVVGWPNVQPQQRPPAASSQPSIAEAASKAFFRRTYVFQQHHRSASGAFPSKRGQDAGPLGLGRPQPPPPDPARTHGLTTDNRHRCFDLLSDRSSSHRHHGPGKSAKEARRPRHASTRPTHTSL